MKSIFAKIAVAGFAMALSLGAANAQATGTGTGPQKDAPSTQGVNNPGGGGMKGGMANPNMANHAPGMRMGRSERMMMHRGHRMRHMMRHRRHMMMRHHRHMMHKM